MNISRRLFLGSGTTAALTLSAASHASALECSRIETFDAGLPITVLSGGNKDLTNPLIEAIQKLQTCRSGGGRILLPPGEYISAPVTVSRILPSSSTRITIEGHDRGTRLSPAQRQSHIFKIEGSGARIRGIHFLDPDYLCDSFILNAPSTASQNLDLGIENNRFQGALCAFRSEGDADNWHITGNSFVAQSEVCIDSLNNGIDASITANSFFGLSGHRNVAIRFRKGGTARGHAQQPEGVRIIGNTARMAGGRAFDINTGLAFKFAHNIWGQNRASNLLTQDENPVEDFSFLNDWFDCRDEAIDLVPLTVSGSVVGFRTLQCEFAGPRSGLLIDGRSATRISMMQDRFRNTGRSNNDFAIRISGPVRGTLLGALFGNHGDQKHLVEAADSSLMVSFCEFPGGASKVIRSRRSQYGNNAGLDWSPSTGEHTLRSARLTLKESGEATTSDATLFLENGALKVAFGNGRVKVLSFVE